MVIAGLADFDTWTLVVVLGIFALFFFLVSLFGGLIAYAIARTRLAFVLGTFTFAWTVGFGPVGHWLGIDPYTGNRLFEAWLTCAAIGVALRLIGSWRASRAPASIRTPAVTRSRRVTA